MRRFIWWQKIKTMNPLRTYFAVNAPSEPQDWFNPVLSDQPIGRAEAAWCSACLHESGPCENNADCDELRKYVKAKEKWRMEAHKARYSQWPWAWADAVLEQENTNLK